MNLEQLSKLLDPIRRRVSMVIGRAVIKLTNDAGPLQTAQALLNVGEVRDNIARVQEYGFTSRPKAEAEAVVLALGGNRDHCVIIATDDRRYRLKSLAEGEVALYTDEGDKIHFKRGNKIEITTGELTVNASSKVTVNSPTATVNASTKAEVIAPTAEVTASTKAKVTSPTVELVAATKVSATTPLLEVSGLVSCSGIAAGGAAPEAGKAKITGSIEATGNVQDGTSTMAAMRTAYNSHTHGETGTTTGTPTPTM